MAGRPGFTWQDYRELLALLRENGYETAGYDDWQSKTRPVILRHDIDNDIGKAVTFARLEQECSVQSTYFALLTSDFYNAFSAASMQGLRDIMACGHEIGLHFDEMNYPDIVGDVDAVREKILQEADLLQFVTGKPVTKVSMHRPSKNLLAVNLEIPGMVNSYSELFFHEFKYLSDSRHRWREPVLDIIRSRQYPRLHILTHAAVYGQTDTDLEQWVRGYIERAPGDRWDILDRNLTDLTAVLPREEIEGQ